MTIIIDNKIMTDEFVALKIEHNYANVSLGPCIELKATNTHFITGNKSPWLYGDMIGIAGDVTGIYGNCSGVFCNFDELNLTKEQRSKGINILSLIKR